MTPFDIISIINEKKSHDRDEVLESYTPWLINHAFSNMMDTTLFAAEMSKFNHLDKDIQFDFYYQGIPKGRRFGKWVKKDTTDEILINMLCERLKCNQVIAKRYLSLLTDKQKQQLLSIEGGDNGRSNNRGGDKT